MIHVKIAQFQAVKIIVYLVTLIFLKCQSYHILIKNVKHVHIHVKCVFIGLLIKFNKLILIIHKLMNLHINVYLIIKIN